ncbi:hypothetical protein ACO2Q8_01730 [Larkinella sp. VNQ87]|uniref:hypothetical protein n=1 Tax=Larkinella sp. VNQ87 TaxID=3400921 RepID=UPI003C0762F5
MKNLSLFLLCAWILNNSVPVWAQSNFKIKSTSNGQEYSDGAILLVPCSSGGDSFDIYASYYDGSAYRTMANLSASNVLSLPPGYSASNGLDPSILRISYSYPQNGIIKFKGVDGSVQHTFTFNVESTPTLTFSSPPSLQAF